MSSLERSKDEWTEICHKVQDLLPKEVGDDAWIVLMASAFITSPDTSLLAQFSTHLTTHDPHLSVDSDRRERLSVRLRDVCLKLITLVGAPKVLSNLMPLAKSEGNVQTKAESSRLNPKWEHVDVQGIHERGVATIHTIYDPHFLPKIFASWGSHRADVEWNMLFTVYGLYLSDVEYLTPTEIEAVAFASIICQGLRGPALWHMRGMGRVLGARGSDEEAESVRHVKDLLRDIKLALMTIVEWVGQGFDQSAGLATWVNVGDVSRELGGWGDD